MGGWESQAGIVFQNSQWVPWVPTGLPLVLRPFLWGREERALVVELLPADDRVWAKGNARCWGPG